MNASDKMVSLIGAKSYNIDNLKKSLNDLLSSLNLPQNFLRDEKILLKPNLVIPATKDSAAITNPNIVIAAAELFLDAGAKKVIIAESSMISADTDQAFKKSGIKKLADAIGVECINLKTVEMVKVRVEGATVLDEIEVPKMLDEYSIVNMPKLKTHIQTKLSCAVKNMKGALSDVTKKRVHFLGLHQAIVDFSIQVKPMFNIVDAIVAMEGLGAINGSPVEMNLIFGGVDPFSVDTVALELIGYKSDDVEYINIARAKGIAPAGMDDIILTGHNINDFKRDFVKPSGALPDISVISFEDASACSACIHTLTSFLNTKKVVISRIERLLKKRGEKIHIFLGPNVSEKDLNGVSKPVFFGKCTKAACDNYDGRSGFVPGCPPAMSEDLFSQLIPLYDIDNKSLKGSLLNRVKNKLIKRKHNSS